MDIGILVLERIKTVTEHCQRNLIKTLIGFRRDRREAVFLLRRSYCGAIGR
jgi:hypothetical protein